MLNDTNNPIPQNDSIGDFHIKDGTIKEQLRFQDKQ